MKNVGHRKNNDQDLRSAVNTLQPQLEYNLKLSCGLYRFVQMYSEGSTIVKQDNKTAFKWFKKAADMVRTRATQDANSVRVSYVE